MEHPEKLDTLVAIMDRLREPGGCPWDREQTFETLRAYLIEECYEVADALDRGHADDLCEELGDLLLQIVFLARIGKERGEFTIDDVVRSIVSKMVRRHPHVFGDDEAETAEEVLVAWERIKRREKAAKAGDADAPRSVLDGLPVALPALLKAQRIGTKVARVGFDWDTPAEIADQVASELDEVREASAETSPEAVREEIGDLLFSAAQLARGHDVDPEGALEAANLKFERRFRWMEERLRAEGVAIEDAGRERLEALWLRAKSEA